MKHLTWFLMIVAVLLLTACAKTVQAPDVATETAVPETAPEEVEEEVAETAVPPTTKPAPTEEPTAEPAVEPTLTSEPEVAETEEMTELGEIIREDVIIEAADGLELDATFYAAEGLENGPGVILLHMLGSRRTIWDDVGLTEELANNGYAVLALDMRGHGDTGNAADWVQAEDDIQRVWQYFVERPEVDEARTAVIGGSIGSNMALIAAANEPAIRTAILLSPGLVYRGVTTEDRLPDYGERPLLIVASENDPYSADSANTLAETAVGETQVQIYENAGHGTNMFDAQPDLTPLIFEWLDQYLAN